MITKYRNKGLLRLIVGFGLVTVGLIIGIGTTHGEHKQIGGFIGVVSGIIGFLIYVFGCADLLKAKGYDSSVSLAFIVPAFCCSGVFLFLAPPVILFALKDKTKRSN